MHRPADKVSFGYRSVGAEEKKQLVSLGIAIVYSGRKPQEVPHAADRP